MDITTEISSMTSALSKEMMSTVQKLGIQYVTDHVIPISYFVTRGRLESDGEWTTMYVENVPVCRWRITFSEKKIGYEIERIS
jgi:hypothetical protein